jgi:hypothetical protein
MNLSSPPTTSGLNSSPPPTAVGPNLSSAPRASGLMNEPPLSPGPAPAPAAEPAPASPSTSLEAQVVRLGLMTTAEVAQTMQEEAETGRSFAELAVESGRIAADDLARLTNAEAAPAAPGPRVPELQLAPVPAPELVESPPPAAIVPTPVAPPLPPVEPEPEVEAVPKPMETAETEPVMKITLEPSAPTPAPPQATSAGVFVRLTSGERISAGRFDTQEAAERRARELMIAIDAHGDWPCVDGRFIKPDAVVSIDVDTGV